MNGKQLDVLCVGLMLVDVLARPADAGIFTRDTTWADDVTLCTGGDALNEAIVLSKLGVKTGLAGRMGGDGFGRFALDAAAACGIDISGVRVLPEERTAVSIVLIDDRGDRHFLCSGGNIHHFCFEDVDLSLLGRAGIVNIGSLISMRAFDGEGAERLLYEARARGAITSADVSGTHRKLDQLTGELKQLDYFFPSYDEAVQIAGREDPEACADAFLRYVRQAVVIKLGAEGCLIKSRRERHALAGFPVRAIDTTGAGDNFVAGFLAGAFKRPGPEGMRASRQRHRRDRHHAAGRDQRRRRNRRRRGIPPAGRRRGGRNGAGGETHGLAKIHQSRGRTIMSLITLKQGLDMAEAGNYALGMFNIISLEYAEAVVHAAERVNLPVILGSPRRSSSTMRWR
jgi:sugar/nucleoside kinase (ribokinase family)